ncbi:hypothetical protein YC2023_009527 [Brassica napus]
MIIGQRLSRWLSYDLGVQGEGSPQRQRRNTGEWVSLKEYEAAGGEVLVDDEDDDGWLATHGKPKELAVHGALDINKKSGIRSMPTYFGAEEEDDDIPDMEEFDEADNVVENDTFLGLSVVDKSFSSLSRATLQSTYLVAHEPDDDNILRTRTNDNTQRKHHVLTYPTNFPLLCYLDSLILLA